MKIKLFLLFSSFIMIVHGHAIAEQFCSSLVGKKAPAFKAQAVLKDRIITINSKDLDDKYTILLFYPADFSYVCPTELRALQEKYQEFISRDAQIFGISVDQIYTHKAWLKTPQEHGGVSGISYPLISDITKEISCAYGVLDDAGVAQRAVFIIDKKAIIQAIIITNDPTGRNIDEILRLLDALQATEHGDQMCPANWQEGKETIVLENEKEHS